MRPTRLPTPCPALALAVLCAALAGGCATLDGGADPATLAAPDAPAERVVAPAHGPRAGPDGWVVTVTPRELAALGLGRQHMELDIQAPDVVYVVDYHRLEQLDAVFARTAWGLFPLRHLLSEHHRAGRVVLRTPSREAPGGPKPRRPSEQPSDEGGV